jgi:hypothetical protein
MSPTRSLVRSLPLCLLPLILLAPAARAATIDVEGQLNSGATWNFGNTYHLTGDIIVPANQTLTIQAGAIVTAEANKDHLASGVDTARVEIIVNAGGSLVVNGSQANPVVFTSNGATASWYGIRVLGTAPPPSPGRTSTRPSSRSTAQARPPSATPRSRAPATARSSAAAPAGSAASRSPAAPATASTSAAARSPTRAA